MERKELHLVYNEKTGSDMYDVAEADAVMDAQEQRIKELEYQLSDKGRKNSELFSTNAELRNRIKELEENLKLADKAELNYKKVAERSLAKIKELEANQPKWISVKDRLPKECERVWLWNGYDIIDGYLLEGKFRSYTYDEPIENQDICPITMWKDYKPNPPTAEISSVDGGEK